MTDKQPTTEELARWCDECAAIAARLRAQEQWIQELERDRERLHKQRQAIDEAMRESGE